MDKVERELLDLDAFEEVIEGALERVKRAAINRLKLVTERDRIELEVSRLTAAVAAGGEIPMLVAEIRQRNGPYKVWRPRRD